MSYFALCTFDLSNASSSDYDDAYTELANLGLNTSIQGKSGKDISLPNTTVAGKFSGSSDADIRDELISDIEKAFNAKGLNSKIFVIVSDNYAWSQRKM
ncbi:hypothetical protein AB4279_21510 [Vibrio cyclitrophicus]